jgi:riboflavin biosynthesis pyrimidine reductase
MRRLWPDPGEVEDITALVAAEARPAPDDRPWVLVNMIASLDGAIAVEGRSGGLGGPADKAMFSALRGVADVILVGAGTARGERYGPARPSEAIRAARRQRGQHEAPRIALVTRSLDLDLGAALFTEVERPSIVITCAAADPDRQAAAAKVAELVVVGEDRVDLVAAMAALRTSGAEVVTCEGGPSLNGHLVAADLLDEWDLTLSPLLVGGGAGRASRGAHPAHPVGMRLDRLVEADAHLLGRWLRAS